MRSIRAPWLMLWALLLLPTIASGDQLPEARIRRGITCRFDLSDPAIVIERIVRSRSGKRTTRALTWRESGLPKLSRQLRTLKKRVRRWPSNQEIRSRYKLTRTAVTNLQRCIAENGLYLATLPTPEPEPEPNPEGECLTPPTASPDRLMVFELTERVITLRRTDQCEHEVAFELVGAPEHGTATLSGEIVRYHPTDGAWVSDALMMRACSTDKAQPKCSQEITVAIQRCEFPRSFRELRAQEHRTTDFIVPAASECAAQPHVTLIENPVHGTVDLSPTGAGTYTVGFTDASNDTFSYRICDENGLGCGPETHVEVTIEEAPRFDGDSGSLAPYRDDVSLAEIRHVMWKVGLARDDLLDEDAVRSSLTAFVDHRLLNPLLFSDDLSSSLAGIRDRGLEYGEPIDSEEFIPDWRHDTFLQRDDGMSYRVAPIFSPSDHWDTPASLGAGFERWMMISQRPYHLINHRYHWGWNRMINYHLLQARYASPLRAAMMHFWFGHFGTNIAVVAGGRENWVGYYVKTIEREALGNFRDMMIGKTGDRNGCAPLAPWEPHHGSIICDAASNTWLDNHNNDGQNQNFARELLELYTTSPFDEVSGSTNYNDEADMIAGARFVSGMRIGRKTVGARSVDVLTFDPREHDNTPESMFAELESMNPSLPITNRNVEPGEFMQHILNHHPGVARFIASKLFSFFVYPDPEETLVEELGETLRGVNYDIAAFMRTLITSEAMFSARARERGCVSSPVQVYSKLINATRMPMIAFRSVPQIQWYYEGSIDAPLRTAGESPLAYPTVFSHGYCGRDPGKDGSAEWLQPFLLVFRVTGMIEFLNGYHQEFRTYADLSDRMTFITQDATLGPLGANGVLMYFEQIFGVSLDPAEREILLEYLGHRMRADGSKFEVAWDPENKALMREKLAGLLAVFAVHPAAGTH